LGFEPAVWARDRAVDFDHIQPGMPVQNFIVESFNETFRDECLNENLFARDGDAVQKIRLGGRATTRNELTAHWVDLR
jgi:putative transposase